MKAARRGLVMVGAGSALALVFLGGCANPSSDPPANPPPPVEILQGSTVLTSGYDFGTEPAFESSPVVTFTVKNTGSNTVNLDATTPWTIGGMDPGDFTQPIALVIGDFAGPPPKPKTSLVPGDTVTFSVIFTPTTLGPESATVTVNTDAGSATATLTGTGATSGGLALYYDTDPAFSEPTLVTTGVPVPINTGSTMYFEIMDTQTGDLGVGSLVIAANSGDFTASTDAPGTATQAFPAMFNIFATTTQTRTVTIQTSAAGNENYSFSVVGHVS